MDSKEGATPINNGDIIVDDHITVITFLKHFRFFSSISFSQKTRLHSCWTEGIAVVFVEYGLLEQVVVAVLVVQFRVWLKFEFWFSKWFPEFVSEVWSDVSDESSSLGGISVFIKYSIRNSEKSDYNRIRFN